MTPKFKFELMPYQKNYIDSIKCLINPGPRRQGKTFAMAYVFIENAFKDFGEWTTIFDHYPYWTKQPEYLYSMISSVFDQLEDNINEDGEPIYRIQISRSRRQIRVLRINYEEE